MKKSTKLLSVLLALVMILSSMTVLASAAKTNYKTAEDLEALQAYSPYGAVTRLSTEERTSILFDYLDQVLGDLNINPGKLFDVAGLSLTVDLRSINALCGTVDNAKSLLDSALVTLVGGLLGIINDLNLDSWQEGMTREGVAQLQIINELLEVLRDNSGVVQTVISTGELDLGVASSAISGLDLSVIADIPGLIKGLIFPLFERKDDNQTQINTLNNTSGDGGVQTVLNSFVQGLFTKPQSTTSYRENAAGDCISDHTLPTQDDGLRYYYVKGADSTGDYYECYYYNTETGAYVAEEAKFYKTEEPADSGEYVYKTMAGNNLKYYENGSYWLPSMQADLASGEVSIDLASDSAASLLYKFIPYVFQEMAPVVLNGSLKKILGEWFGAKYNYVGDVGSEEVAALEDSGNVFFTQEQGEYLWEWSDYAVINGTHYYRFQDQIFMADIGNVNPYFNIINWEYVITDDFLNEFIPGADGNTPSAKGYTTILQGLNDFVVKVANTVLSDEILGKVSLENGDNSNLVTNAKNLAQTIVKHSPESIFGADFENGYYDLMTNPDSKNQEILCGIAATLIEMLMPQMILPSAEKLKGQSVGSILAALLRELATQLIPTYNYDALIYSDYNDKTFVAGKDNSYWLDVCLTIGVDIGMAYLHNLADMGEDTDVGYKVPDSKTYDLATFEQNPQAWEATIDWIIDWALSRDYEWSWKMANLVTTSGLEVNMGTAQDPWQKLGVIFMSILPVNDVFNIDTSNPNWLESLLRDNFVLALLDLDLTKIAGGASATGIINIPTGSILRTTDTFSAIVTVVRNLLNSLLRVTAGVDLLDPATITSIDSVFNQQNIAVFAGTLVNRLYTAYTNGLLDTVMPILGFFVGWSTDAQKLVSPTASFSNTDNYPYMYSADSATVNSTLNFRNDSSGMLLKHRATGGYDAPYSMVVTSITSSDSSFTTSASLPLTIAPGASGSIPISMTYSGDKAVSFEIKYYYLFKDGTAVGGEQTAMAYTYVSNRIPTENDVTPGQELYTEVNNTAASKVDAIKVKMDDIPKYRIVSDLAQVAEIGLGFSNTNEEAYGTWIKNAYSTGAPDFLISKFSDYVHGDNKNNTMANNKIGYMDGDTKYSWIQPFAFNYNIDLSGYEYGDIIDLGTAYVEWHNHCKGSWFGVSEDGGDCWLSFNFDMGDVYYTDTTALEEVFNGYTGLKRGDYAADADAEWAAFQNAMLAAAKIIMQPIDPDTFAADYSAANLQATIENIETAYEALAAKPGSSNAYTELQDALAAAEPTDKDTNYQDYELYEYWDYEEARTNARNVLAGYQAPAEPENYINGSSLSEAEINALIAAEGNEKIAAAIGYTVVEPTAADLEAYAEALANFTYPSYTALELGDYAAKLGYYKDLMISRGTANKQFLEKELQYAAAQNYQEADYSAYSWAVYERALDNAQTVNSDPAALQSVVFDAKYELMKAENELILASRSAMETGALDQLQALSDQANVIFNNPEYYGVIEGVEESDAYAQLITALGYKYTDESDNEVILYADSAAEYLLYDREITGSNLERIAAAEAQLEKALANFECTIKLVEKPGTDEVIVSESDGITTTVNVIDGITPGSIATMEELLSYVELNVVDSNVTTETTVSRANAFGTGAKVDINLANVGTISTYYVLIYGDVTGDGAVDGFDAIEASLAAAGLETLNGVYYTAADIDSVDGVTSADYAALQSVATGNAAINQAAGTLSLS